MGFNFPSSPTEGQAFGDYIWDGEKWVMKGAANTVSVSPTPPPSPENGQQWFDSDTGQMFVWYDDGSSAQWVQTSGAGSGSFVDVSGDTMVGDLTISKAMPTIMLNDSGPGWGILRSQALGVVSWDLSMGWDNGDGSRWLSFDRYVAGSYTDSPLMIDGGEGTLVTTSGKISIQGSSTAVLPTKSGVFLELSNAYDGAQYVGGEIQFSGAAGNPYAVIRSELISGPSPYFGNLSFATREESVSGPLIKHLTLFNFGTLYSGAPHAEVGGPSNYSAYNKKAAQNFLGYTENQFGPSTGPISGYFIADNNKVVGATGAEGSTGVYAEARVWNMGSALGGEIDAQNLSGVHSRDISPNEIFGPVGAVAPWTIGVWTQPAGSHPGTSYDISAAFGVTGSPHPGIPRFRKGLVISRDAIRSIGGHTEAIALPQDNQITWQNIADGTKITRLLGNGTSLTARSNSFLIEAPNADPVFVNLGSSATGDRAAYLFLGASSTGGNQDAIIARQSGVNGQLQIQNQGTGAMVWMTAGVLRGYFDGFVGNFNLTSTTDANAAGNAALSMAGGIWAQKGIVSDTSGRFGSYLRVGGITTPANTAAGDLSFGNAYGSGGLFNLSSPLAFMPQIQIENRTNDNFASYINFQKMRTGGPDNGACQVNDNLGTFVFVGKDKSGTYRNAAFFSATVNFVDAGSVSAYLAFAPSGGAAFYMTNTYNHSLFELRVAGDVGGGAGMNTITGTSNLAANSTGVGSIKMKGATARDSAGFIKIYIGTTAYYVPVFSAITG